MPRKLRKVNHVGPEIRHHGNQPIVLTLGLSPISDFVDVIVRVSAGVEIFVLRSRYDHPGETIDLVAQRGC